jgi:hypothetical protein
MQITEVLKRGVENSAGASYCDRLACMPDEVFLSHNAGLQAEEVYAHCPGAGVSTAFLSL